MPVVSEKILKQFTAWFDEAEAHPDVRFAEAMSLATIDDKGNPSVRMVLLKGFDARGFVFYTNYHSRKSADLTLHPKAALCLYWEPIRKQIRIEGRVELVSDQESDVYFASRPRESQLGAWASEQSDALENRDALLEKFKAFEAKFAGKAIPRPAHWGGWRVIPQRIEFWQEGEFRLHERVVFGLENGVWVQRLLNP